MLSPFLVFRFLQGFLSRPLHPFFGVYFTLSPTDSRLGGLDELLSVLPTCASIVRTKRQQKEALLRVRGQLAWYVAFRQINRRDGTIQLDAGFQPQKHLFPRLWSPCFVVLLGLLTSRLRLVCLIRSGCFLGASRATPRNIFICWSGGWRPGKHRRAVASAADDDLVGLLVGGVFKLGCGSGWHGSLYI